MTPQAPAIHHAVHAQVVIARQEALRVRAHTDESYTKLAKSSAKLEKRIESNRFHITLERAILGKKPKEARA